MIQERPITIEELKYPIKAIWRPEGEKAEEKHNYK
jgi:hypothetical protein